MQKSYRFVITILILGSYLLSACAGAVPQNGDSADNSNANSNEVVDVDNNSNDDASNTNTNTNTNENENDNGDDSQGNDNDSMSEELEFSGVVDALTDTSITINGVVYNFADFTEFNDVISVGDQVKIHVIVSVDGTFILREIELLSSDDKGNSNSNFNGNDNDDDHNSNDDDHNNSNDDDDDDDDNDNDNHNDNDKD